MAEILHLDSDLESLERARRSRDPRFDGRFFVGVRTTGIYCRPICPAPEPKAENVVYYPTAAAAAAAGLRPCLRCRPEAAPGTSAWTGTSATVRRALRLIDDGALDDDGDVPELARRLGVGDRHLRRLFLKHLGATPVAVALTRRLHFARRLIREGPLPMVDVAYGSGFGSNRRFNAAFHHAFGCSPSSLRRGHALPGGSAELSLRLSHRCPFDWRGLLDFLVMRAVPGVEAVDGDRYLRTFRLGELAGIIRVRQVAEGSLELGIQFATAPQRLPSLLPLVQRVRRLFDLDADPAAIAERFASDPVLGPRISARPGVRLPGSFDAFEVAVRAVLGQQVTVKGASTLAGRLVASFGDRVPEELVSQDSQCGLSHYFPWPETLAAADLRPIGLPAARAATIRGLAAAVASGELGFDPALELDELVTQLERLPGIGEWTAHYVAMRALGLPDAFPAGDLGLRKAVGRAGAPETAARLKARAESWRPWRAYAAILLWSHMPTNARSPSP